MTHQEMKVRVAAAVRSATEEVFSMMLGMEALGGETVQTRGAPSPTEGVVSLIGLAGPWQGTGCISCSAEVACHVAGALMMGEYQAVNEEVLDAIAELTNMIVGNVKTIIETEVGPMGLSIPTVIFGRNFSTKSGGQNDWIGVPFRTGSSSFTVQVCLIKKQEGRVPGRVGFTNTVVAAA